MKSIRLLPLLVLAASALLVLKTVGIVTGGGYTLTGTTILQAQEQPIEETDVPPDGAEGTDGFSEEALAAADAAADSLFNGVSETDPQGELEGIVGAPEGSGATQDVILQRLGERRVELDALAAELETRMAIVEAAELRLEERMAEIAAVEERINAIVDAQEAATSEQFEAVVAMYGAMRAADAATIFNDLDMEVLTQLGKAMNPRVLGPIMAKMLPERAQQLTIRLAVNESAPAAEPQPNPEFSHLPQIMGE